jgi:hypothetical protein
MRKGPIMEYQKLLTYLPWADAVYGSNGSPAPLAVGSSAPVTVAIGALRGLYGLDQTLKRGDVSGAAVAISDAKWRVVA